MKEDKKNKRGEKPENKICHYNSTPQNHHPEATSHVSHFYSECGNCFVSEKDLKNHKVSCHKNRKKDKRVCHLCGMSGLSNNYNRHILACTGKKDFRCYFCHNYFTMLDTLRDHLRTRHTNEKPFPCTNCHLRFPSPSHKRIHERRKHGKGSGRSSIICYFCGKKHFYSHAHLNGHIKGNHIMEKAYKCGKCCKRYHTISSLQSHMKTGGNSEESRRQHGLPLAGIDIECPKCLRIMKTANLREHMRYVHSDDPNTYKCPICCKTYSNKKSLGVHIRHYHGHEKFTCTICGKIWKNRRDLKEHEKIHQLRAKITCPKCGSKILPKRYNLHIRDVHGPRRFICYFCGKPMASSTSLNLHLQGQHLKEIPVRCTHDSCSYRTHYECNLRNHAKMHRNGT